MHGPIIVEISNFDRITECRAKLGTTKHEAVLSEGQVVRSLSICCMTISEWQKCYSTRLIISRRTSHYRCVFLVLEPVIKKIRNFRIFRNEKKRKKQQLYCAWILALTTRLSKWTYGHKVKTWTTGRPIIFGFMEKELTLYVKIKWFLRLHFSSVELNDLEEILSALALT